MWQKNGSSDSMDYANTWKYINELNKNKFAGYTDWRLPTLAEAMSLLEPKKKDNLYIDPVFDKTQSWIWTSDLYKGGVRAWIVNFSLGYCSNYDLYIGLCVRAVRSG